MPGAGHVGGPLPPKKRDHSGLRSLAAPGGQAPSFPGGFCGRRGHVTPQESTVSDPAGQPPLLFLCRGERGAGRLKGPDPNHWKAKMICDDLWCSRHCKTSPRPGTLETSGARLRRKSAEILTETFRARLPSSADADAAPPSNFSLRGRPVLPHTGAKSVSSERSRTSATRRRGCRETRAFQGRCFHKTLHLFILPHTRSPLRLGRANAEIQRKMTNNTETQRNSGTLSGHEGSLCDNCIEHP